MTRKIISLVVAFAASAAGFVASVKFFSGMGYRFLAMLLGSEGPHVMSNPVFMISLHSIIAVVVFFITLQVVMNRYLIPIARIAPVAYAIIAIALIMVKSRGVQGVNLNPLDVINQLSYYPATVFFNLLVLIPFGMTFRIKGVSFNRSVLSALLVSLLCEAAQLIFKLGVFDIVDIYLNIFGFVFGYCVADFFSSKGLRLNKIGKYFYRVVRV